jgi:hypothetical protein
MLNKRTQIVIGIAILIVAAAFLLVGVEFANLQGILFQNGANSLQLFANNLAAAKNALYLAPSSMSITLSGNNSLCSWNSAIDAYDCSGGSKIYNISYASGPTLDAGTSTFSVALCFIVSIGPPGSFAGKASDAANEIEEETPRLATSTGFEEAAAVTGYKEPSIVTGFEEAAANTGYELPAVYTGAAEAGLADETGAPAQELHGFRAAFYGAIEPTSFFETIGSYLGNSRLVSFYLNHAALINNLLFNIGAPTLLFWFGENGPAVYKTVTSLPKDVQSIGNAAVSSFETSSPMSSSDYGLALQEQQSDQTSSASSALSSIPQNAETYNLAQEVIGEENLENNLATELGQYALTESAPPTISGFQGVQVYNVAVNASVIRLQITNLLLNTINLNSILNNTNQNQFSFKCPSDQIASGSSTICSIPVTTASQNYQLSIDVNYTAVVSGVHAWSNGTVSGSVESGNALFIPLASSSPYSTPEAGVSTPAMLSSPYSFVGNTNFNSPMDLILSAAYFLAGKAFQVYGQTASCIGSIPSAVNLNSALSAAASLYGQATDVIQEYNKVNVETQMGTYFVGYGGEVYVNGQSNGLPTLAGAPVITDLSDLCSIATTTSRAGQNLQSLVFPSGSGSVTFSITQGMYNTMCSTSNSLYPETLSNLVDTILNSKQSQENVSILLPPQYAIELSNSSKDSDICLYRLLIGSDGNPAATFNPLYSSGSTQTYITEYGLPVTCINITNMTNGYENLAFTEGTNEGNFNIAKNINVNSFFLNNPTQVGFSIPPGDYPNQLTITAGESSTFQAAANFIGGPPVEYKTIQGVDSPALQLLRGISKNKGFQEVLNGLSVSGNNILYGYLISVLINDVGNTNLSYYPTDYTNVTFNISRTTSSGSVVFNINLLSNNLVFGVYPNNYNSLGGTAISQG